MEKKQAYDVAIIDSGIYTSDEENGICFKYDNSIITCNDITDDVGHGTAINGIIKKHNPYATCFHIKIFDKNNESIEEEILLVALNYIHEHIECKIINMSLGLTISENNRDLYDICQKLKDKGVIIVAAFDNLEIVSYPAAFNNVIGVASSIDCSKITDVEFYESSVVNVCGKGGLQRVNWISPKYTFTQGNSYACAHITGILSHSDCRNMEEALIYLRRNAIKIFINAQNTNELKIPIFRKSDKAVIFPFNKEMHSLLRFKDMLCVEISGVYDIRQSARVNASVNKLLNIDSCKDFIIKNIENIDWNAFDIFIIGHTEYLTRITDNNDLREKLILNVYNHGKYIYCFDDISDIVNQYSLSTEYVYYPKATLENITPIPLGMLYRPWVPMLGVFGTTSKQGKFTLQLILREKFLRDNYRVGQIGTEPSAYLFNMDFCFHFGYHSTTNIYRQNMISHLNTAINNISQKNVDIIISGCQSGTVTYDFGNVNYYTFSQTEFLLGTLPDAVILCVNSYDEINYIKRTIQYIESCVESKVIALVIYPMGYNNQLGRSRLVRLSNTELEETAISFSKQFNIPSYILGKEPDMEKMYASVITFFTSNNEE